MRRNQHIRVSLDFVVVSIFFTASKPRKQPGKVTYFLQPLRFAAFQQIKAIYQAAFLQNKQTCMDHEHCHCSRFL